MTKKEWGNLRVGDKVYMETVEFAPVMRMKKSVGIVRRFNANYSQVLIEFQNINVDRWFGRLGIELLK